MVSKFVTYSGWTLYYGLSTDELPKDVPNGSRFTAIDTDDEYWYDRENQGWYDADGQFIPDNEEEGDEDMFVNITYNGDNSSYTCDKSSVEIAEALTSGKMVYALYDEDGEPHVMPLTSILYNGQNPTAIFNFLIGSDINNKPKHILWEYEVKSDKSVSTRYITVPVYDDPID